MRVQGGWKERGHDAVSPCHPQLNSARVPRKRHAEAHREREVQSREELNTRMVIYSS